MNTTEMLDRIDQLEREFVNINARLVSLEAHVAEVQAEKVQREKDISVVFGLGKK